MERDQSPTGYDEDDKDQSRQHESEFYKMEDFGQFQAPNCNCQVGYLKRQTYFFTVTRINNNTIAIG